MPENRYLKYTRGSGPVYGPPPKGPSEAEQANIDLRRRQVEIAEGREAREAREDAETARQRARAYDAAKSNLARMLRKIDEIADDADGWGETGTGARVMRNVPLVQTAIKDLDANLDTLRANFAFDALQAMREASKTGGALGNVTERELELLERKLSNVEPTQSYGQFIRNLAEARASYWAMLKQIDPDMAQQLSARRSRNRDTSSGWGTAEVVD